MILMKIIFRNGEEAQAGGIPREKVGAFVQGLIDQGDIVSKIIITQSPAGE